LLNASAVFNNFQAANSRSFYNVVKHSFVSSILLALGNFDGCRSCDSTLCFQTQELGSGVNSSKSRLLHQRIDARQL
jgi:hypothetical protein